MLRPSIWHHAVNDEPAMALALAAISTAHAADEAHSGSVTRADVHGIEVDVRCSSHSNLPVLSHDALHRDHHYVSLDTLASALLSLSETTPAAWRVVLKLDFKDALSMALVIEGRVPSIGKLISSGKVETWGNADLVRCALTDEANFHKAFPSPARLAQCALAFFPVLSIGYFRGSSDAPYNDDDYESLSAFMKAIFTTPIITGEERRTTAITLPLRLALFRGDNEAESIVRDLLRTTKDAFTQYWGGHAAKDHLVFLTVWRGREESISDKDAAWLHANFPGCTIDRA
jgi:hypothetical protein